MTDYSAVLYKNDSIPVYSEGAFGKFKYTGISTIFYSSSKLKYFEMMAYDTSASTWRTWVAVGAPDITASQYVGTPFPFTTVFVISTIEGR